jgi:hypothetical protein
MAERANVVRRREGDDSDAGVLQRGASGAWRLIIFIGTVITGAAVVVGMVHRVSVYAAEGVVAPVEKRLDEHLANSRAMREVMDRYVEEQRDMNRTVSKKLDALCRANPKADCPLGE